MNLNARRRLHSMEYQADYLRIKYRDRRVVDFGVNERGGLEAGLHLARICLGDAGQVSLIPGDQRLPQLVQVLTDQPGLACMGSQYGGWQVKSDDFFAIGSGPIRLKRGNEKVLDRYDWRHADSKFGVLVLESDKLPDDALCQSIADQAGLSFENTLVCVAATKSLAGTLQIVARSVEATMHKLFELDVDLEKVTSGHGLAPLPPVAKDDLTAIGRTNDAILYCGNVTLWVDMTDDEINELGPQVPSSSSSEHGKSFEELFKACGGDFYKMDPMLFSAARIRFISNQTGNSFVFGETNEQMVYESWSR